MKKPAKSVSRPLNKSLFEAGLQCGKRLYLDFRGKGGSEGLTESRRALSQSGQELLALARQAFPKGTEVKGDVDQALRQTAKLLEQGISVVFGAVFRHDDVEAHTDILLSNPDGSLDLFEVKSGTRVKPRYVLDLALQVYVIESAGHTIRNAGLLHVNPRYVHDVDGDIPVHQVFRNADVTEKVRRQLPRVAEQLELFRTQVQDRSLLDLPTGTWCSHPFPCPHLGKCSADDPEHPLRDLPDLTREQETAFHTEAVLAIDQIDPKRSGLTFRQRRTIQGVTEDEPIVETFVRDELRNVGYPVHCLAIASVVDVLPRFKGQRPWRRIPHAWFCHSLQPDGKIRKASFVHLDRDDPRGPFVKSLAQQVEIGGSVVTFGHDAFDLARALLQDLPGEKAAARAVLARPNLDLGRLLESGVFHPDLGKNRDLRKLASALLGDATHEQLGLDDEDKVFAAIEKATAPRVRVTTREKLGGELLAWVEWQSRALLELFQKLARGDDFLTPARPSGPSGKKGAKATAGAGKKRSSKPRSG